jgi:UDP-N-acetylmuramoylalanine--D-glutamate ligase
LSRGAQVVGVDHRVRAELGPAAQSLPIEVVTEFDKLSAPLSSADLIVVSPGVPLSSALLAAERAGVSLVGELSLAAACCEAPIVAIGGTNGKSTTTALVAAMLSQDGRSVFCGGNLGTPLSDAVGRPFDCLVVEVSSFQLERVSGFRPRVSVLLNITEDHLDRHGTFEAYAAAKGNAFAEQSQGDVAVALHGDPEVLRQARRGAGRIVTFGQAGDYVADAECVTELSTGRRFGLEGGTLSSRHNRSNAAAAIAAAAAMGASPASIQAALDAYRPLPHRLSRVGSCGEVTFYYDSKATNVGAAVAAVLGLPEARVVLIAGGKGKEGSYQPLRAALAERGRAVVLIGEAATEMAAVFSGAVDVTLASDMPDAVAKAYERAQPGDAVLLSPACASFDMFTSYAHRGRCFAEAVSSLTELQGVEA